MNSIKKVVIFYPHIGEYGGIERNIIALATEVVNKGLIPVLLCYYDHINMGQYVKGMEVVALGDHWSPFAKGKMVSNWFRKHAGELAGMPFFFSGKAGFYAFLSDVRPYVLHYTDPPSLLTSTDSGGMKKYLTVPRQYVSDWIIKQGVVNAEVCLTMTKRNAVELESLYGEPFDVVYQGGVPPADTINKEKRCMKPVLRLFSICRINASKKLDWILKAAASIKKDARFTQSYQGIKIVLAGKGPEMELLVQEANTLGLTKDVEFPGFLTPQELEDEYAKADIFVVPARQGFGLPVLEALYRYVPVVLNRESRVSEILEINPWVSISEDTIASFTKALEKHILTLQNQYPDSNYLVSLPTEQLWAEAIGAKCLWW